MPEKKRILYVGGFMLPDKNAAAHRVLGIASSLRDAGYLVEFLDVSNDKTDDTLSKPWQCQGFTVYTQRHSANIRQRIQYSLSPLHVEEILSSHDDWFAVIAYNYPALALSRLKTLCHVRGIKVLSDCTEWYAFEPKTLGGFLTYIDSEFRMRYVQKHLDGMIAISEYLGNYYRKHLPTVVIPPTVNLKAPQWHQVPDKQGTGTLLLTYAGSYSLSRSKDRLDLMIAAIASTTQKIKLNVIGYTKEQYLFVFGNNDVDLDALIQQEKLSFLGRLTHEEVLKTLQCSDFCLFFRKQLQVTQAGFPTKFVESISCGVPVLTTDTSDLKQYIKGNGFFVSPDSFSDFLNGISKRRQECRVNRTLFDYRNYTTALTTLLEKSNDKCN